MVELMAALLELNSALSSVSLLAHGSDKSEESTARSWEARKAPALAILLATLSVLRLGELVPEKDTGSASKCLMDPLMAVRLALH